MNLPHLDKLLPISVVRQHERGMRRYYPIPATKVNWYAIAQANFILSGIKRKVQDPVLGQLILFASIDRYIEQLEDGKLWVRTIYRTNEV